MSSELQVFSYNSKQVRTVERDGEVWFIAKDVADILEIQNIRQNLDNLEKDEKGVYKTYTPGGNQDMAIISEPGLYALVLRSNKPEAKAFSRWVRHDVLPSIRKTGSYSLEAKPTVTFDPMQSAKLIFEVAGIKNNQLALALDKVYKTYTGQSALLVGEVQLEAPVKEQALTPSQIAEAIGMGKGKSGGRQVNALLDSFGFQRRIAGNWEPAGKGLDYAVVVDTNKKHSNGTPVRQIKWNSSIVSVLKHLIYD